MTGPLLSVAMCTHNGSRYLETQLQSIASQTLLPVELVVCDDNSTDRTYFLLQEFKRRAPFLVRIYSNGEALGPAKNFEKAIRLCEGEVIVLSDQDDMWRPDKLEKLHRVFEQNTQIIYAFSDAEMVDEEGNLLGQTLWDAVGLRKNLERFSGDGQLEIAHRTGLDA